MLTVFSALDLSHSGEDDFELRIDDSTPPIVGASTWMNPDTKTPEWEVISTHLFRSLDPTDDLSFCLVDVAKGAIVERNMTAAIHLYLLDGEVYTYCICGVLDSPPELGDFAEYEKHPSPPPGNYEESGAYPVRRLPTTKRVTHYQTLMGDGSCGVYVANLQRVPALVPVAV